MAKKRARSFGVRLDDQYQEWLTEICHGTSPSEFFRACIRLTKEKQRSGKAMAMEHLLIEVRDILERIREELISRPDEKLDEKEE